MRRVCACLALGILTLGIGALTSAPRTVQAQSVSARDRESAAEAFDRGTAAYIGDDFRRAAHWFETANNLAPAAPALVQAVRSHRRAGNALRAATLALRLLALYPNDEEATRTAELALASADRFFRVDVECDGCTVQLDGTLVEFPSFFLEPGTDHVVVAGFETGERSETVRGGAGDVRTLAFEAPPHREPESSLAVPRNEDLESDPARRVAEADAGASLQQVPLWVTLSSFAITGAVAGTLIWSGIDTLEGVPAYEANPTESGLAEGQAREERTNWLIAGTALSGTLSLLLTVFTDWSTGGNDGDGSSVRAQLHIQSDGAALGVAGCL